MEIGFRVAQSSSILHGVHWGNFLPDTECLVVVKSHLIEVYQVTQDEKPLYCLLEQILGFQVAASSKLCNDSVDLLVLTSNGVIHVMEFVDDYFKSVRHLDTGLENIDKLECVNYRIICSDNQKNLKILSSDLSQVLQSLEVQGSIIDWQLIDSDLLILEFDTKERIVFWSELTLSSYTQIKKEETLERLPRSFTYFQNYLLVFSDTKVQIFTYQKSSKQIDLIQIQTLEKFFSSSTTIKDTLYISFDDGSVLTYDSKLNHTNLKIKQDSLLLGVNSLLLYISHHGESGVIDLDSMKIIKNYRSGSFIDGFYINEFEGIRCPAMICASVNFCSSEIIKIEKRCSDVLEPLRIPDIAKYSNSACVLDDLLLLLPDLKVVNMISFEMVELGQLGLRDERTLWVAKVEQGLAQVTENRIWVGQQERAQFGDVCTTATQRDNVLLVGLASQEVWVFRDLELKTKIKAVDFSALYLTLGLEVLVGLQQTGINKYSLQGDLISKIETKGIPNSYIEKFNNLLIGTRDGFIEVLSPQTKTRMEIGSNPVFLSDSYQGIYIVSSKSYLIYNESLDFKRLLIPDSKFIIESNFTISVSKDLNFYNLEEDLRYSTSQEVLHTIQGQINRMIKLSNSLIAFSYSHSQNYFLSVFDIILKKQIAFLKVDSLIRSLYYIEKNNQILTGNDDCKLYVFSIDLNLIVCHTFEYKVTAICYHEQFLYVASENILYSLLVEDICSPVVQNNEKFVAAITEIAVTEEFLVLALALCGIRIVTRDKLQSVVESSRKLDYKKILISDKDIYAISIDGWVFKGSVMGDMQELCYTGSGARVLTLGSLYSLNLIEKPPENLIVASLNGEILELYPKLKPEIKQKAKELFGRLSQNGILDSNQTQELSLDILRLVMKLPDLNTEESTIKELLNLSA